MYVISILSYPFILFAYQLQVLYVYISHRFDSFPGTIRPSEVRSPVRGPGELTLHLLRGLRGKVMGIL